MNKEFSARWENTLFDASLALLDITIDHHKQCIHDIQHKLQHRTEHLKSKCDTDTAQQLLDKTDALFLKYTTRTLLNTKKSTKRLKRLHTADTPHKHTNSQATNTTTTPNETNRQTYLHKRNKTPPKSTHTKTTPHHTPLSRHTRINNKTGHTSQAPISTGQDTQDTSMQHPTLTPLMQIQATPRNTQSKSMQPPKLRIPPRSQLPYNKQHNSTPTQQLSVRANHHQHTQYPPTNKPMNTTPQSITQNIQSQIHNFILSQVHKHHK